MWRLYVPAEVVARRDRYIFTFANVSDIHHVKKGKPWSFQCVMLLLNNYNGFSNLAALPLGFICIWVEIIGMSHALMAAATAKVVGETLGRVL